MRALRAVVAWAIGSAVGLACSATTIFAGPLANVAGGVDLSFIAGMVTAASVYLVIRALSPETRRAPGRVLCRTMVVAAARG